MFIATILFIQQSKIYLVHFFFLLVNHTEVILRESVRYSRCKIFLFSVHKPLLLVSSN